ncbi:class C beta-lactamase-related serine hydrolase [Sinirhodobacter populi]|uniref:Class C beta-lactamase-related serine hydrolase n=1 Tax=Paenirhodobacter populi TaxID=2306993 RepID=A0A443KJR6_9RHOB|nr:serine hydrolase [Sinirhodobacter populi]RWR32976.1 class C beta-lactamase-related serine hydrolase [Sinirhodobacter populi]
MVSRRSFSLGLGAVLAAPALGRAQGAALAELRQSAGALRQLHAITVQRGDDVILSEAPRGPGLSRSANIKSCSKSVLALLVGSAIAGGQIRLSDRLGDIAPRLVPADATEGAADLTIEDLVTLRTGLASTSGANYGAWVASPNWVAYALRQPRIAPAGGRMIYSTGSTHVLGAALATATGDSLLTLSRRALGAGLGIEIPSWTRDPQGFYFGGNEMALTPEAMLRIAVMMRDGGRYRDRQVIDRDWIEASRQPRTRSPYSGLSYGYGWFLSPSGWTLARGYGGQLIAAHPARGLAVAITSDPQQPARSEGYFGDLMRLLDGPVRALG